jgi:hypothetical protein
VYFFFFLGRTLLGILRSSDKTTQFQSFLPKKIEIQLHNTREIQIFLADIAGFKIRGFLAQFSPELDCLNEYLRVI